MLTTYPTTDRTYRKTPGNRPSKCTLRCKNDWAIFILLISTLSGQSSAFAASTETALFGNLRLGFIHSEDETHDTTDGSAIGGKLGYLSPDWKGLSAGATFYTSGALFGNENGDFFSSENNSYAILGEAYIQGQLGKTQLRIGRFELDTPHADTDDIRMVPNTFQGILLSNSYIPGTTLYLTHLGKWAGVDSHTPERFTQMNGDNGITALGAVYTVIDQITAQGWYYSGRDFAQLVYLEAIYEIDRLNVGIQFSSQTDDSDDNAGPDGEVWGLTGSYTLYDVTLTAAYNHVSGTVSNGFGGGPYFTSADDHTIDGVENQEAAALGIEYAGIEAVTLGLLHVDFDQGTNETDYYASYELLNRLGLELIYTDMHEGGEFIRLMANYSF